MRQILAIIFFVLLSFLAGFWAGRENARVSGSGEIPALASAPGEDLAQLRREFAEFRREFTTQLDEQRARLDAYQGRPTADRGTRVDPAPKDRPADPTAPMDHTPVPVEISLDRAPTLGPADAPVTLVVFSDFECPHCATLAASLSRLSLRYPREARIVFKHFPVPTHRYALSAHQAAAAAAEQGRFWEMHDILFAHQDRLDGASLRSHAERVALNLEQFDEDRDSSEVLERISEDVAEARLLRIDRVPTLFVNGRSLVGERSFESLSVEVEAELRRLRAN